MSPLLCFCLCLFLLFLCLFFFPVFFKFLYNRGEVVLEGAGEGKQYFLQTFWKWRLHSDILFWGLHTSSRQCFHCHWNCFRGKKHWERWGGAQMGFSEHIDTILNCTCSYQPCCFQTLILHSQIFIFIFLCISSLCLFSYKLISKLFAFYISFFLECLTQIVHERPRVCNFTLLDTQFCMDMNNTSCLHSVWIFIFMVWVICMLAFMWFCTSCQLSVTAGRQCMNLVDSDRAQVAREAGYTVTLTSLQPVSCSPKNNLLIGQKRSAATSWSCNRFSLAR